MAVQSRSDLTRRYITVTGTIYGWLPYCACTAEIYITQISSRVKSSINPALFNPQAYGFSAIP